jgi:hypothetical protein
MLGRALADDPTMGLLLPSRRARTVAAAFVAFCELGYRWPDRVITSADGRAALLFSRPGGQRRWTHRLAGAVSVLGVFVAALGVPIGVFVGVLLALPPSVMGVVTISVLIAVVVVAMCTLGPTLLSPSSWSHSTITRKLRKDHWWVELLGANPTGGGHGAGVMATLLAEIDAADEPVGVGTSEPRNRTFYLRHGFHPVDSDGDATGDCADLLKSRTRIVMTRPSARRNTG